MADLSVSERLDQEIADFKIAFEYSDMLKHAGDGYYYNSDIVTSPVILVRSSIRGTFRENVAKAHELGHHHAGTMDATCAPRCDQHREEARATRHEILSLMPIPRLIDAYEEGVRTPFDLSNFLEIPIEELSKGIGVYYGIYGPQTVCGQYVISWEPFNIKKDHRRKPADMHTGAPVCYSRRHIRRR